MKANEVFAGQRPAYAAAWRKKEKWTRSQVDPACGLICEQLRGINYHTALSTGTVHRTRENAEWTPALLALGDEESRRQALSILTRLLDLQDLRWESPTYGLWPYLWEEPLTEMKNPDWNWAPFIGRVLLTLLNEFEPELPDDLCARMRGAVRAACECILRRRMSVDYTNISLMSSFVLVCAGETLGEEDLVRAGVRTLAAQTDFIAHNGGYAEYNSPYYGVIDIEETGRGLRYFKDEEARRLVRGLHEAAWSVFADHFHWGTRQIAPPHARCYADIQDKRIVSLLQIGAGGDNTLIPDGELDVDLLWPFLSLECPERLREKFAPQEQPRVFTETFYRGYDPIENSEARVLIEKGTPAMTSYTYLHPRYCLGSFARHDLWNQRRPLMGYFAQSSGVACLRMRCLHDDMDYASAIVTTVQHENAAAGALSFVTDHGDYHYILTPLVNASIRAKRLVLRIGVSGQSAAVRGLGNGLWRFELEDRDVTVAFPRAAFGDTVPAAEPYEEDGETGVQLVFYRGPEKVIDFSVLGRAFACYWLEVTEKGASPASGAQFEESGGRIAVTLTHPEGTLHAQSPAEVSRFMPPVEGLVKRFRNGGFFYEQTEI